MDLFVECIEACVHAILCSRAVYPKATFERRLLYGAPVFMSRHPGLCDYIAAVLANAKPLLLVGVVERIVCCITGPSGDPVESHIFDVGRLGVEDGQTVPDEDSLLLDTEAQLRDLVLRAMSLQWQLPDPVENTRFSILVHTRDSGGHESGKALETGNWFLASKEEVEGFTRSGPVVPLRSVTSPGLQFQLYTISQQISAD